MDLPCFGGFRSPPDDPPKPWRLRTEALRAQGRRWVRFLGATGLPVGLHAYLGDPNIFIGIPLVSWVGVFLQEERFPFPFFYPRP